MWPLKSTWGFWKANTERECIHQVTVQGYHRSVILSTESLIAVQGFLQGCSGSDCCWWKLLRVSLLTVTICHLITITHTGILILQLDDVLQVEMIPVITNQAGFIIYCECNSRALAFLLKGDVQLTWLYLKVKNICTSKSYQINIFYHLCSN